MQTSLSTTISSSRSQAGAPRETAAKALKPIFSLGSFIFVMAREIR
jgi:hypothetical protein